MMMKPRRMLSSKQGRRMRTAINGEARRYRRCLALVPHVPAEVVDAGMELFGDEAAVALWLCEPARALGGKIPIRVAQKGSIFFFSPRPSSRLFLQNIKCNNRN